MIDVNDLNKIDCNRAREANHRTLDYYMADEKPCIDDIDDIERFINSVEALQRKYAKPIAALLKKDANG